MKSLRHLQLNVTAQVFDHVTFPSKDLLVTMKYPSDGDDDVV
ncbi:microviridin/marinostatin family tricyclic proteinase inhibitor [Chryseobacterium sp. 22532]